LLLLPNFVPLGFHERRIVFLSHRPSPKPSVYFLPDPHHAIPAITYATSLFKAQITY
jgi:hypothetical protein